MWMMVAMVVMVSGEGGGVKEGVQNAESRRRSGK